MKKDNEIDNLIGRLQGFDDEELKQAMTDGLDQWCQARADRARRTRRVAALVLLLLTTTALAMTAVPQWRPRFLASPKPVEAPYAPQPAPQPISVPVDSTSTAKQPDATVDYTYVGRSCEGYSVTYGVDSRTLTYTRREGNRIVRSVLHNVPDSLFIDTLPPTLDASDTDTLIASPDSAARRLVYDFLMLSPQGDTLYCAVVDSAAHSLALQRIVARGDTLVLPSVIVHKGQRYTVGAIADTAVVGNGLRCVVALAAKPFRAGVAPFGHMSATATLIVPCNAADAYEAAPHWGESFGYNIEEMCSDAVEVEQSPTTIHTEQGRIIVSGTNGEDWYIYNNRGQLVSHRYTDCAVQLDRSGLYYVRIGNGPLQKVMLQF